MSALLDSFLERMLSKSVEGGPLAVEGILAEVAKLAPEERKTLEEGALQLTGDMRWVPNPGPQTEAYYSEADEVLYGGSAGSGKTDLGIALALQRHKRSLILRRLNKEVEYLVERTADIVGHRDGYNGQHHIWRFEDGRVIQFGGCQHPGDEHGYKGAPKTLVVLDEASGFLESQVRFLKGWLRSTDPDDKPQLLLPTNPPDSVEGAWIVRWFGPWVDPMHPLYPTPSGRLLWYREVGDKIEWRPEPFTWINETGKTIRALSRVVIRGVLEDNPDYARTDYGSRLEAMPEELRVRYARGEFVVENRDDEWQLLPSAWVKASQERWTEDGRKGLMTSLGVDIARGGPDKTVIVPRHGQWIDRPKSYPGTETPDGPSAAALVVKHRRDRADVRIDMGGGWGGSPLDTLKGFEGTAGAVIGINPSVASAAVSRDGANYKFTNLRDEMFWRLREGIAPEARDPIILPPGQDIFVQLCALRFSVIRGAVKVGPKEDVIALIGHSPDEADAIALTCMASNKAHEIAGRSGLKGRPVSDLPKQAHLGYSKFKDRYRSHRSPRP